MRGNGGGGKSTRSILRANVLRENYKYVPPVVLCDGIEFQKQGVHFAHVAAVTMQETKGGQPLEGDITKAFFGNQQLGCRPNYGSKTLYIDWGLTAKFWEMNMLTPAIHGDPRNVQSLKSWWRRLIVLNLGAAFSSDPDEVDVNNKVFAEDSELGRSSSRAPRRGQFT